MKRKKGTSMNYTKKKIIIRYNRLFFKQVSMILDDVLLHKYDDLHTQYNKHIDHPKLKRKIYRYYIK